MKFEIVVLVLLYCAGCSGGHSSLTRSSGVGPGTSVAVVPKQKTVTDDETKTIKARPGEGDTSYETSETGQNVESEAAGRTTAEDAEMPAVCKQRLDMPFPQADKPSVEQAGNLSAEKCSSAKMYYGIGQKVDPIGARHCAYLELDEGDGAIFGGSGVLMMIYANGLGVPVNLDLALKFMCIFNDNTMAPGEMEYRRKNLESRLIAWRQNEPSLGKFDICDDITSGFMAGGCAQIKYDKEQAEKDSELRTIVGQFTREEKKAFQKLRKTADSYIEISGDNEVDLSGTLRGYFVVEHKTGLREDFLDALRRFEKGQFSHSSKVQFNNADKELNWVYREILNDKDFEQTTGTTGITREGIKKTQRSWVQYSMAWIALVKVANQPALEVALKTHLWSQRIKQLKRIKDAEGN